MLGRAGALAAAAAAAAAAPRPPMGYSTWNMFPFKGISEAECVRQADALAHSGLVAAGYTVFVVDEPCFTGRDAAGELVQNATAWPRGLGWFSGYLARRNMTLGIYTDAGRLTCQQCPGSEGHEAQDMRTFRKWGAGYVKVDRCFGVDNETARASLPDTFRKYRAAAGDGIQLSAILAGTDNCWEWGKGGAVIDHCRTTQDIFNSFSSALGNLDHQERVPYIDTYAGPGSAGGTPRGYFNDLDMLLVGLPGGGPTPGPGLTAAQEQCHMALWAALKSPLLVGCNVTAANASTLALLTNPEVVAVSQDPLGVQARRVRYTGPERSDVSFLGPPPSGVALDSTQHWDYDSSTGQLVAAATGSCLTVAACGSAPGARVQLCDCSADARGASAPCANASCPGAGRAWRWDAAGRLAPEHAPGLCLQGILGPGPTYAALQTCGDDTRQQWGAPPAAGGAVCSGSDLQCLTASPAPSAAAADLYTGPLGGGRQVAVLLNRGSSAVEARVDFAELGWAGAGAVVRDVLRRKDLGHFVGEWTTQLAPSGCALVTLTPDP
eukprot:TRINITY_DN64975_c0_g1_i1.p1 TRINITY_DN64975_c0_g1~~TRINITY_DN64975_c0_g1_i1.p1  ORF type:complete len:577 (+),score=173.34 TRINITY_DN64975_c0_g1_i1:79-1731(+)